jgi:hypothetical protein
MIYTTARLRYLLPISRRDQDVHGIQTPPSYVQFMEAIRLSTHDREARNQN